MRISDWSSDVCSSDLKVLGIGTDSNQNGLHPGQVLTSMRKRIDVAVYDNFTADREGEWRPGVQVLGLAEGGLDWVVDKHNAALITPEMEAAAEAAEDAIVGDRKSTRLNSSH